MSKDYETHGIKKSIFQRAKQINPSKKFSIYSPKEDEITAFRLPLIIIGLGIIFSFTGTFFNAPSNTLFTSISDILLTINPLYYPFFGLISFMIFIYIENFENFKVFTIVSAWILAGFLVGIVNGPTKSEGILIQMMKTIFRLIIYLFLAFMAILLFLIPVGDFLQELLRDPFFFIIGLIFLIFTLLVLIPLSIFASVGFALGVKFNNV